MTALSGAVLAHVSARGSALASWRPLYVMLGAFVLAVAALLAFGRSGNVKNPVAAFVLRAPAALERLTGIPGWAAATVGLSLFGLLMAGQGFYSDVAWHIGLGRDEKLFTAPHTSIVLGLALILGSSLVGIAFASLQQVDTRLRWKALRIPWSTVPLFALGSAAVTGFPLDELWHKAYGVDVTMWSPTHMLMILGAAMVGVASWLVLADAGVRASDSRWARALHVLAAWLTLQGLAAPLGEFAFGVPQFQQIFHPIIVSIAAAFAVVCMRLVLGPWWAVLITAPNFAFEQLGLLVGDEAGAADTRAVGVFVASALVVEVAARLVGTTNRLRFAVVTGIGVGTVGLAAEWAWNRGAYQPWTSAMLPDAVIMSTIAAVGTAVLAVAFARVVGQRRRVPPVPGPLLAVAAIAVLACIVLPLPRHVGEVTADVRVNKTAEGDRATFEVTLTPADAADEARWFQASSWQGGGLALADFEEVAPGRWVTEEPVPITGSWKTLIRLHRGSELMTVPVWLPADPEIDEPEIPAVDRKMAMASEKEYLLRETHDGSTQTFAYVIYGLLMAAVALWAAAFVVGVRGVSRTRLGLAGDEGPDPVGDGQRVSREPVG